MLALDVADARRAASTARSVSSARAVARAREAARPAPDRHSAPACALTRQSRMPHSGVIAGPRELLLGSFRATRARSPRDNNGWNVGQSAHARRSRPAACARSAPIPPHGGARRRSDCSPISSTEIAWWRRPTERASPCVPPTRVLPRTPDGPHPLPKARCEIPRLSDPEADVDPDSRARQGRRRRGGATRAPAGSDGPTLRSLLADERCGPGVPLRRGQRAARLGAVVREQRGVLVELAGMQSTSTACATAAWICRRRSWSCEPSATSCVSGCLKAYSATGKSAVS